MDIEPLSPLPPDIVIRTPIATPLLSPSPPSNNALYLEKSRDRFDIHENLVSFFAILSPSIKDEAMIQAAAWSPTFRLTSWVPEDLS